MRHNSLALLAALLFMTLAASCSKQSNSDTKTMDMAKKDSMTRSGDAPVSMIYMAPTGKIRGPFTAAGGFTVDSVGGGAITVQITGSNTSSANYKYMAYYGPNDSANIPTSPSPGGSAWNPGTFNLPHLYFFPLFMGTGANPNPATWTAYTSVSTVCNGQTGTVTTVPPAAYPDANIQITVIASGGGPGK